MGLLTVCRKGINDICIQCPEINSTRISVDMSGQNIKIETQSKLQCPVRVKDARVSQ